MAEYSAKDLKDGLPALKSKQTVVNEWRRIVADDAGMAGHVRRRGQTDYYDDVAAAALMRRLGPKYGGKPPAWPDGEGDVLRGFLERQEAEIARLEAARKSDAYMYRSQVEARDALIADLRASLADARSDAERARMKTARTYRFDRQTLDAIDAIAEREHVSATEAVARAVGAYADSPTVGGETAGQPDGGTSAAIAALTEQLSVKDSQISSLAAALASAQDTAKAAQALHAADVQRLEAPSDNQAAPDAWKAKGLFARVFKR